MSTADCPVPMVCSNSRCVNPNTVPACGTACTATTSCTASCFAGSVSTTCGSYGVCANPCTVDACSAASCGIQLSGTDNDADGIPDRLEYDLAYKFFPDLWLQHADTDLGESYPFNGKAIPYVVEPLPITSLCNEDRKCLVLRFGTPYFHDTGDPTFGGGHIGDSEFYAALVIRITPWATAVNNTNDWQMIRDFTAAHWGAGTDSSMYGEYSACSPGCSAWNQSQTSCQAHRQCFWFGGLCTGGLDASFSSPCSSYASNGECFFAGGSCHWVSSFCSPRGDVRCYSSTPQTMRRTAYASEGKHGLYHTDAECDSGNFIPILGGIDDCPNNSYNLRSYVSGRLQNVGSSENHAAMDTQIQHPDLCHLYDVWSGAPFGDSNVTSYKHHFLYPLSWDLP